MASFDIAITKTLANEGGAAYTETPGDTGGATKYGISQKSYPTLNIKALTEAEAKAIYKRDYWDKIKGDLIADQDIAESIFDFAVNSGVGTASKLAQTAACDVSGVKRAASFIDGVVGPTTVGILNTLNSNHFLAVYSLLKISRYAEICNKSRDQSKFLLGWVNRTLREWIL
jgi:lysozyme family protein